MKGLLMNYTYTTRVRLTLLVCLHPFVLLYTYFFYLEARDVVKEKQNVFGLKLSLKAINFFYI